MDIHSPFALRVNLHTGAFCSLLGLCGEFSLNAWFKDLYNGLSCVLRRELWN